MAYISNSNDNSLPMRVKSQCVLLRSSIDEFEKSKNTIGTTNNSYGDENTLKILDSIQSKIKKDLIINERDDDQLKFYQTIINELEFHQSSLTIQHPNAMQQD